MCLEGRYIVSYAVQYLDGVFSHHIGKREDPGDEVGIKCLRKSMEVPGAHALDITVRLLEPGHLEEDYPITFFENKGFSRILNFCFVRLKKIVRNFSVSKKL